jgi:hypothetical protein
MNEGLTLITLRTDKPEHHWLLEPGFHLLNMWTDGIWLVDENHPAFHDCVQTAINIAKTMGDKEHVEKYTKLLNIKSHEQTTTNN